LKTITILFRVSKNEPKRESGKKRERWKIRMGWKKKNGMACPVRSSVLPIRGWNGGIG